ncbi:MAG TPA: proton-conducting transporter membrane subunit [Verrucomicrobiae bacterium]
MILVLTLILLPFLIGACLRFVRADAIRQVIVTGAIAAVCGGVLWLAAQKFIVGMENFPLNLHATNLGILAVEIAMGLFFIWVGARARNWIIVALALAQGVLMTWFELAHGTHLTTAQDLFVDKFAVIMALINGIVGGGICLYALGYMREYHEHAHADVPDRRPLFFSLLFLFMGAMFGLIFANNLIWLFLFWEITTLCSFLLIGYTQTAEAQRNALRALVMNLAGGLAFAIAIVALFKQTGGIELQAFLQGKSGMLLLPAAMLCFAGITKSAQLPFSSWLLGAMVAPTPVSALLHSSTMVKAGVYLILRMSPVITDTKVGMIVALVGSVTFVAASFAAITASDAKRVLAWSTIANLGLIVLCAGIGTAEAVWAGVLLIIFHAVGKCLLFLCVGVVEHKLHSRDIEAMSGLIVTMPKVSVMMQIGMAGMFLAPFGMLISKWAVLKAVVDASPLLSVFIVFGSAATLFFWVKWMGKLLQVVTPKPRVPKEMELGESIALHGLAIITFLACLLFPLISSRLIEPYVYGVYGHVASLGKDNILIMTIMIGLLVLFPLAFFNYGHGVRVTDAYLGGANANDSVHFVSMANQVETVAIGNYYLRDALSEAALLRWGVIGGAALLTVMLMIVL